MRFLAKAAALTLFLGSISAMPVQWASTDDDPWVDNRPCPFMTDNEIPPAHPVPGPGGGIIVPWAFGDLTFNPGYNG